jgi:hypothetical protein
MAPMGFQTTVTPAAWSRLLLLVVTVNSTGPAAPMGILIPLGTICKIGNSVTVGGQNSRCLWRGVDAYRPAAPSHHRIISVRQ